MIDWKLAEELWNKPYKPSEPIKEQEMVKRSYNLDENEPDVKKFDMPSAKEHLFQVTDVYTAQDNPFAKGLPDDVVAVKLEVVGGDEEGRTMLNRIALDETAKGFFATRLFLKAIGEAHKGAIELDSDRWIGRQFYATVVHNGQYANIKEYNFDKVITQTASSAVKDVKDIAWEE